MAGWSSIRARWVKPEVFPLIGAMAVAVSFSGIAIYNQTRNTIVTFNKSRRKNDAGLTTQDELVPISSAMRGKSTSIFGDDRSIFKNAYAEAANNSEPLVFTVKVGEQEEEEEEEAQPEVESEPEPESEPVIQAVVDDVVDLTADDPEKIQAALDKALDVLKAEEQQPPAASV